MNVITKLPIILFILAKKAESKIIPYDIDNETDALAISACRDKMKLLESENIDRFEVVKAQVNGKVTLFCHFCDESDDAAPKIWYRQGRFDNRTPTEVELGMEDELTQNRVYVRPDHSLIISSIIDEDAGLYFCSGPLGEESENNFNYLIDVVNGTIPTIIGTEEGWFKFEKENYEGLNEEFMYSELLEYSKIRDWGILMKVSGEWGKWGPCNGCTKTRRRIAECTLRPTLLEDSPKEENVTNEMAQNEMLLLKSFEMSCHSVDFAHLFPNISKELNRIKNYGVTEVCYAPCKFQTSSALLPRYKNTVILMEGDHITLICPEVNLESEVLWRKDGLEIEPNVRGGNIIIDTFSNLYIISATREEAANYTCYVNDVRMQEIIVVVEEKSVVTSRAFFRHIQYLGFIFLFSVIFYTAGQIIVWNRRHTFKKIDLTKPVEDFSKFKPKKPIDDIY